MAASPETTPVEWRADLGGQFDSDPHGVADVGMRRGPWTLQLYTDTLEARVDASGDAGRSWLALRGELGAAGLMISPWSAGAPDPSRALSASYAGVEGGVIAFGPAGLYGGGTFTTRGYTFGAMEETAVAVPASRLLVGMDAVVGLYRDHGHVWVQGGMWGPEPSPHVSVEATWRPGWWVGPSLEARAGAARGADELTRVRLGGLNPYVIPLAGAAWAEWWVDDYAAARVGPAVHLDYAEWGLGVAPFADLAVFGVAGERRGATGLGGRAEIDRRRLRGEFVVGVAPWIPRQPGVSRVSAWLRVGLEWGRKTGPLAGANPGQPG